MIVQYVTATLEIHALIAGSDAAVVTHLNNTKPAGDAVFTTADVQDALEQPNQYRVDVHPAPTGVVLRSRIALTSSISPIDLSESPTITAQLKQPDGTDETTSGVVISIVATGGVLSSDSITTNGSGNGTVTLKPNKSNGATITASSALYLKGTISIPINSPSTSDKQSWLENDDIKPASITSDKQSRKATIRTPGLHNFWFINKAFQVQIFDVNNDGNTDEQINSIVVDDLGFFYVNCFEGPGATNPVIKRLNKNTGAVDWSVALTHDNLTSRLDGMAFDGKYIWVASANYIRRVNVLNSADTTEYQMATDPQGGNVQAMGFDGEFIWLHLRGGTNPNADKIWKVNLDGTVASTIDYRTPDPIGTGVRDIKQFAMDEEFLYFTAITPGVTVSDWTRIKRSDGTLVYRNEGDLWGSYGVAVDNLSRHIYTAGGQPGGADQINLDTTDGSPRNIALNWDDSQWYDLSFDGKYVWGIGTINESTATRRVIRKYVHNVAAATIDLVQAIDFDNIAVGLSPTALAFDGQYLYVANFASTTNSVVKIFVGA